MIEETRQASYVAELKRVNAAALVRVASTPPPDGQRYPPGARVRIADDLGSFMSHFPCGVDATVRYTYAHAFGGDAVKRYALDVDGYGATAWYDEDQLTPILLGTLDCNERLDTTI